MKKTNEAHSVEQSQADATLAELGLNYPCTDVGNMERFIDQHEDKVRFIPERKAWVLWDGTRWRITGGSTVFELALQTAKNIYDEARDCSIEVGRRKLAAWALQSQASYRVQNMTHMAAKHLRLVEGIDAFDTDPLKLNCLNGVVDLRSCELIERSPQDKVMKLAPVAYRRHAKCPRFNRFLHEIFNDDQDIIAFIQRAIGHTITGATTEQVFFLAYGTGSNGKSTLFETILDIVGDYGRAFGVRYVPVK